MPEAQLKAMTAPFDGPRAAIMNGVEKHTKISGPILAIFATSDKNPVAEAQAKALETAIPTAKVVRLPNANHYVFNSNEADVLREMNAFIANLPK
jgi:alpha-beta hydrolase superfamily lysophospholipase